jgi:AcrR family transcriptional regulator
MPKAVDTSPRQRRRGPELEAALLDAAWDELVEAGYARLTMESVAARAHTGVAVLYRRWANKDELALAAIEKYGRDRPVEIPDTGSLRGDLLGLLKSFSETRAPFMAIAATAAFSGLVTGSGLSPAQVRQKLIGDRPPVRDHPVYRRAKERGELDPDRIPEAVLEMPFDLVRHDLLMSLKPVKRARLEAIVDELFLPLATKGS